MQSREAPSESSNGLILCTDSEDQAKLAISRLLNRTSSNNQKAVAETVQKILDSVKEEGDEALFKFTKLFDGFYPNPLTVSQEKLVKAWDKTPLELKEALQLAHSRINEFHQHQIPQDLIIEGVYGEKLGRRWLPVEKAGIYIPGGRAAYPSTVLMNAIPAKVAGVKRIVMASPGGSNGELNQTVLAAAYLAGIQEVIRVGGAQAIAALAYGTESIPKVDVISGPGNIFVTLAKKAVYGQVGIDSLAGPSEVVVIADKTAKAEQVAADLLAQAEHDPLAASILLTTEKSLADAIPEQLSLQLQKHPRKEICEASLSQWGLIAICKNLEKCIELSDYFAPEHLELLVENPHSLVKKIKNAGAIFIGPWSPEAVGDYLAGPNHTLPTSGTAKFNGALSVETFMKNTSLIEFNKKAFEATGKSVSLLAKSEGLHSHSESIKVRQSSNI